MTDRPRSLTIEHTARRVRVAPFCAASSAAGGGSQIPRAPAGRSCTGVRP
jgi:hypothetical protein